MTDLYRNRRWWHPVMLFFFLGIILALGLCSLADTQPPPAAAEGKPSVKQKIVEPSTEHENYRRRLKNEVRELWYYLSAQLGKIVHYITHKNLTIAHVKNILNQGIEYKRAMLSDLNSLNKYDGYDVWRKREAAQLSDLVQSRLHLLQNPSDCKTARKLLCKYERNCGFGCRMHLAVYCFMIAYYTQRTMILDSNIWGNLKDAKEAFYLPLSERCVNTNGTSYSSWPGENDTQVVDLRYIEYLYPPSAYPPLSVPEDLSPRLERLHGNPFVWWVGQFFKYMLRPNSDLVKMFEKCELVIGYRKPIVGVHIPRMKISREAKNKLIKQYMNEVEEYFKILELSQKVYRKRVYLASDERRIIAYVKENYPEYKIFTDELMEPYIAAEWAPNSNKYNLTRILMDAHFLSLSDHLICNFSSHFCRLAYEIMQTHNPDAGDRYRSMGQIYQLNTVDEKHYQVVILPHKPRSSDEIDLLVGDTVQLEVNHWNGFSTGINKRSGARGLYPSFKVNDKVITSVFPKYPEVSQKGNSSKDDQAQGNTI